MKAIYIIFLGLALLTSISVSNAQSLLNQKVAEDLSKLPLACILQEFPNKTSHSADGPQDARLLPSELHPVFYGCFDWHSSVHGHWMLVKLLKLYPDLPNKEEILQVLRQSFDKDKMVLEAAYFNRFSTSGTFERTYGWAWLLKLDEELYTWNDAEAKIFHDALQPLTQQIVMLWKAYLPKQTYPNRTGVHSNSAFALAFAIDWARALKDYEFEEELIEKSMVFYYNYEVTPAYLEPDGSDFFSPSLMIADLMTRVLEQNEFVKWLHHFYDQKGLDNIITLPVVSDRNDYQIVHLDGLSFSRAWCIKSILNYLPGSDPYFKQFESARNLFLTTTLPEVFSGHYGGAHWLASFAVYAL